MKRNFDVIVIGVGAMGASACFHLAKRGMRVLGLERFDVPHAMGSSHGSSRMIRLAYHEHPDYVPLLKRAYALWDELEQVSGSKLLYRTGGLYMGPSDGEIVRGALASARTHALAHELIASDDLPKRFPQFRLPEGWVGVLEPEAGFLLPERVIAAYAEAALRRGAEIHGREPVLEWKADAHRARVRTAIEEDHAKHLVICGGVWSDRLVADLGVPLRVTRQVLGWVWPKQPDLFALGRLPVFAIDHLDGTLHYGFPMMPDVPGFKIAHHGPGETTDPDQVDRNVRPTDEQTFRPILRQMIPDADGPLLSLKTCLYTHSPDSHSILDRHPRHPRVVLACGFSGHGFKFASAIGEVLSDFVMQGRTQWPIQFLGLSRFG